jgi:hypothetical protein
MKVEINFYEHCDYEHCALGSAEFECPNCHKWVIDYGEVWWSYCLTEKMQLAYECDCETEQFLFYENFTYTAKI